MLPDLRVAVYRKIPVLVLDNTPGRFDKYDKGRINKQEKEEVD
ncbi:hypothetical protein [Paraflavitalea speifideaquila]|nr:hypothetical protein [Paraflavitalea speifideiaquila]